MSQASPGRAQPSGQAPEPEEPIPSCTPRGQLCFPYKRADAAGRRNSREGPGVATSGPRRCVPEPGIPQEPRGPSSRPSSQLLGWGSGGSRGWG